MAFFKNREHLALWPSPQPAVDVRPSSRRPSRVKPFSGARLRRRPGPVTADGREAAFNCGAATGEEMCSPHSQALHHDVYCTLLTVERKSSYQPAGCGLIEYTVCLETYSGIIRHGCLPQAFVAAQDGGPPERMDKGGESEVRR